MQVARFAKYGFAFFAKYSFSRFAKYSLPWIRGSQILKSRAQDKQAKEGISGDLQQRLSSVSVKFE